MDSAQPDDGRPPGAAHHRLRWVLRIGAVVVVAVVAAGAALFATRDRPRDRSTEEVLDELRAGGGADRVPDGATGPEPGVYPATGSGGEYVGFSPLDEPFGPNVPATVTYEDDGCWTFRVELNTHHNRGWTLCSSDDGLAQRAGDTTTSRVFPGIDFENTSTFACEVPAVLFTTGPDADEVHDATCTGTATGLEGTTTFASSARTLGTEQLEIGGEQVEVMRVHREAIISGGQEGAETIEWWLVVDTGLPVRVEFDTQVATETPFGEIDYRDLGTVQLDSLNPQQ